MANPQKKELKKQGTTIYEKARKLLGITRDQYAFCEYAVYRCADPRQKFPGWCCDPKEDIADFVGISRVGLFKMAREMEAFGLIEISATGAYRGTEKWMDTVAGCKQSLQDGAKVDVNKVYIGRKQSLQKARIERKQSLHVIKELELKEIEGEGEKKATPTFEEFEKLVDEYAEAVEAKKIKSPPVAPPPHFDNTCPYCKGIGNNELGEHCWKCGGFGEIFNDQKNSDGETVTVKYTERLDVPNFYQPTSPESAKKLLNRLKVKPKANTAKDAHDLIAAWCAENPYSVEWSYDAARRKQTDEDLHQRIVDFVGYYATHSEPAKQLLFWSDPAEMFAKALTKWLQRQNDFDREKASNAQNGKIANPAHPSTTYAPPPKAEKVADYYE